VQLRVHSALDEVPETAWDALLDAGATPFVRWAWLEALERSGCASAESGWRPCHFTLWRAGTLVAAAPAYLKDDSDGDFSRDWHWADAAARAGVPYYPKLVLGVPFTPVTGRRVLVAPGEARADRIAQLLDGVRQFAASSGARSLHVLFPDAVEARELEAAGLARRVAFQYHWNNDGYQSPEQFLARFDSKRRNQARRERAAPATQGITIETVRGEALARQALELGRTAFELHRSTVDKLMWGRRWLNLGFYERVFERMPGPLEVVLARKDGRVIAGAFNLASNHHLYGRYWGCLEEHKFLHFNVCLYHSIDECIERGIQVFEGGAGGEHKLVRGFEPAETYSMHQFFDERLERPLRGYIADEAVERAAALARWRAKSPVLKHPL
jgi:predicted N-acyltransferase